jgi:hypothetical protein
VTKVEPESELLYDGRFTAHQLVLATSPLRPTARFFIFQLNAYGYSPYVTSSLTRGWICRKLALGSLFVTSYDPQGYGGGIQPSLHMGQLPHAPSLHRLGMNRIENTASNSSSIVACIFVATDTRLSRHFLSTVVSSGSTIPPFWCHVTI